MAGDRTGTIRLASRFNVDHSNLENGLRAEIKARTLYAANRRALYAGFCGPGSPDEFPFASSLEVGTGVRVAGVPLAEQRIQGGILSQFYRKFGIGQGDPFRVTVGRS